MEQIKKNLFRKYTHFNDKLCTFKIPGTIFWGAPWPIYGFDTYWGMVVLLKIQVQFIFF